MDIQHNAPVTSIGEIAINAPIKHIWSIMTDINNWPHWNPDIKEANMRGVLKPGSRIVWKSGPGTIRSEVLEVIHPNRIVWKGSMFGITAIHVWTLAEHNDGTIVTTEESWEGIPARLFRNSSQKQLDHAITAGLQYLKAEAER